MTFRERNNIARKKCYIKQIEIKYTNEYELYSMDYHRNTTNHTTWWWRNIPEIELEKAGFINDYNKLRLKRKENQISTQDSFDKYSSLLHCLLMFEKFDGTDGLSQYRIEEFLEPTFEEIKILEKTKPLNEYETEINILRLLKIQFMEKYLGI